MIMWAPSRLAFVISDGAPAVLQVETTESQRRLVAGAAASDQPSFSYYAVSPEGAAPYRRARVWTLPCPDAPDSAAPECETASAKEVRAAVWAATTRPPDHILVYVAPEPP